MMELMIILRLVIHLMLAGWIQHTDATDCTLHVSSQSSMVSLQCSNSSCQLELQTPQGRQKNCYSNYGSGPNCYLDNCNQVYNICDISQNQSSSRCGELSNGGQGVHNSDPPINCTVILVPDLMQIFLRCQRGACNHTARGSNTACSRELGIPCEEPTGCIKSYSIYTIIEPKILTPEPLLITSVRTSVSGVISTYSEHESLKISITEEYTSTAIAVYSTKPVHKPTIAHSTVNITIYATKTIYSSTIVHTSKYSSTFSFKEEAATSQTNIVLPVTGAMMGLLMLLLIVVTTGWMWTCWTIRKKKNLETRPQNISAAALNLNDNIQTPLQRNIAYEGTSALTTSTRERDESQAEINPVEPTYEIIPLASTQIDDRNDYNRLNREITQQSRMHEHETINNLR